jgi:probable selenium-dependent hydroxylase accessory protein YqeC
MTAVDETAAGAPAGDLWQALELGAATDLPGPPVVAIVGGGGKTSLLYRLGREAGAAGLNAVLAGTTRFTPAPHDLMPPLITASPAVLAKAVEGALKESPLVVASTGLEPKGRLGAIDAEVVDELAQLGGLGLLALEADGSKLHPFKAPADHEPAVPASATHVVAVVGLDALDAPLDEEHVHRPERVRAIAGERATCSADVIAGVLASERGGRKGVEDRRYAVLVNKADLGEERAVALGRTIRDAGVGRVVVAALHDEENPVRAVLVGDGS